MPRRIGNGVAHPRQVIEDFRCDPNALRRFKTGAQCLRLIMKDGAGRSCVS